MARWCGRSARGSSGIVLLAIAVLASACAFTVGRSVEQREINFQTFGSGDRAVLLIGGLHTGPEDNSRVVAEQIASYLREHPETVPPSVTVYIVPSANPDGSALGIHTNARGVDLNRNWPADDWMTDACHPSTGCQRGLGGPAPLSEPETYALYHFIAELRPEITVVWHADGALVEANEAPGAEAYGQTFAQAAGYPYIEEWSTYRITGQLIDALEQRLQLRAVDIELTECCVVTEDAFDRNLDGIVALLDAVERSDDGPTPTATPKNRRPTRTPTFELWTKATRTPTPTTTPRP